MTNEEMVLQIQADVNVNINLEQLYYKLYKWIRYISSKYNESDHEDLEQEAFLGLTIAAHAWKPEGGASFLTFARCCIRRHLLRYKNSKEIGIRIPDNLVYRLMCYDHAVLSYTREYGRDPSDQFLMGELSLNKEQLEEMKRIKKLDSLLSLDLPDEEGNSIDVIDPDDPIDDLLDDLAKKELKEKLWSIVDSLPERESRVIHSRYEENKTLNECGRELGITPERVRVIEKKGIRRIRDTKSRELQPYLTDDIMQQGLKFTSLKSYKDNLFCSSVELAVMRLDERLNKANF